MTSVWIALAMPIGSEWICLAACGLVIAAAIFIRMWARARNIHAFPVLALPPGPGRFRVFGVRRTTKQDTQWECEADSPANAQVKAELEGIIVTKIERVEGAAHEGTRKV